MSRKTNTDKATSDSYWSGRTVTVVYDRLKLEVQNFAASVRKANDWVGPFSLFITLLLTLLASDFKDRFGLKAIVLETIAVVILFLSGIWCIIAFAQWWRAPTSDELLTKICDCSIRRNEWRVLFFMKARSPDNLHRVLTYHDPVWNCYHLPHMRYDPTEPIELQETWFKNGAAGYLGLASDQVSIAYMEEMDLDANKMSERAHKETDYSFKFYSVQIINAGEEKERSLSRRSFEVGGKFFSWLTPSEMENDFDTRSKNGEMINWLNVHHIVFFQKAPDVMKRTLEAEASPKDAARHFKGGHLPQAKKTRE